MIQKWVLGNGTHILVDSVGTTDTVCIGFWFKFGSRDERSRTGAPDTRVVIDRSTPGRFAPKDPSLPAHNNYSERGFTHFLEHMLFKGTERRSAFQIAKEIDRVGGFLNAFTEREATCFYATLPYEHLPLAIDVLSDMVFYSILDSGEIEKEKSVIINEVLSLLDSPEELAHESYLSGLWGAHPLAWRITGDVEDVREITRHNLERFYAERFVPSNLIVSVAGRFDPKKVYDLIAGTVDHKGQGQLGQEFRCERVAPTKRFTWKHKRDRFKQVQIYTGTDLPIKRGEHRPLYDALVFSNAVGESMSSRLFQEIRETKALCYSISSYRTLYTDISLWTIYSNTAPETVSRLLEALNGELRRLLVEPLTEGEVADAKNHLKGTLILAKEDMEVRMKRLFRLHSLVYEIIEYDESIKLIDEVTRRRILRITDQLLRGSQFNLVAYGGKRIKNFGGLRFEF